MSAERISMSDASWLIMESRERPMHVATLLIFSMPPDAGPDFLRELVAGLRASTEFVEPFNLRLSNPKLMKILPTWTHDYDLDLEYHVRHLALPRPGGERELGVLISRLHSNPMDFSRPLWEYFIIEGLEDNRFAIYFKMHHSIVDGIAGVRMLQRSMSTSAAERNTPALWSAHVPAPEEGTAAPVRTDLAQRLTRFADTVGAVGRALATLVRSANDAKDPLTVPFQTPVSILNHRIGGQRRFATQVYELARIKRLAKAANCTLNDMVLALCSGALRRFLKELNALPGQALTAGIPVSLRTKDDQGAGSAVSFITSTLATNIADPVRRVEVIRASTQRAKSVMRDMPREAIEAYTAVLMAPYTVQVATGLEGRTRPVFNVPISNVPGPTEFLYFRGARLESMYPVSAVTHGQALNITCYSYAGTLSFGFAGCRDTLPRMQRLAVYTGEALEEMEKAFGIDASAVVEPPHTDAPAATAIPIRRARARKAG